MRTAGEPVAARVQVAQRLEAGVVRHGQIEEKNVGLDLAR